MQKSDKEKYVYSRYGIKLDSASSWSFSNDFARNVMIFGDDDIHHLALTIARETALDHKRISLILIVLKQTQNFV